MDIHSFNPFSAQFQQASVHFHSLPTSGKMIAVIAAIVGGILTPFLFCTGSFALFQLSVKWLRKGENSHADKVDQTVKDRDIFASGTAEDTASPVVGRDDRHVERGEFVEGKLEGPAEVRLSGGAVFRGLFSKGKRVDPGSVTLPDGEMYTTTEDGKEHLSFPNGDFF